MPDDPTWPDAIGGEARFRADLVACLDSLPVGELAGLLGELPSRRDLHRSPWPRSVVTSDPDGPYAGPPASAAYTYVPSKTALNALTVQYANELRKDGILVNAAAPGFCATDINNHTGHRTAAQGAAVVVRLATLGADGPTGGFFSEDGPMPW
jgi:NAD(P)-dependent dehydrogenase (short-subunit alcohol dehydrogenase family)